MNTTNTVPCADTDPEQHSLCSCSMMTCDSLFCFAKRNCYARCSCVDCGKPKICPFYKPKTTEICEYVNVANEITCPSAQNDTQSVSAIKETCNKLVQKTCCEIEAGSFLNLLKDILAYKPPPITPCCPTVPKSPSEQLENYIKEITKSSSNIKPNYRLKKYIDEITSGKKTTDICSQLKKEKDTKRSKALEKYIDQITHQRNSDSISKCDVLCCEIKDNLDQKQSEKIDECIQDLSETADGNTNKKFGEVCCLIKTFLDEMRAENKLKKAVKKGSGKECQLCKYNKNHRESEHIKNNVDDLSVSKKSSEKREKSCKCKPDTLPKYLQSKPVCDIGVNTIEEYKRLDDCNDICRFENRRSDVCPATKSDELEIKQNQIDYSHENANQDLATCPAQVTDITFHAKISRPFCFSNSKSSLKGKEEKSGSYGTNLFMKLNEALKACTCKICECIPARQQKTLESCDCKPCECVDCLKFVRPNQSNACSCKPCNCEQCAKLFVCKGQDCSCIPCECVECSNQNCVGIVKRGHNDPKQINNCIVCDPIAKRSLNGQTQPSNNSTCDRNAYRCVIKARPVSNDGSLCEWRTNTEKSDNCLVCCESSKQSSLKNKQTNVHPSTCSCNRETQRNHPPAGLMEELGISTLLRDLCQGNKSCCSVKVYTTEPKCPRNKCNNKMNNSDTLAMFAAVSNTYSIFTSRNTVLHKKTCDCKECKCITSKVLCKENIISIKQLDQDEETDIDSNSKLHISPKVCDIKNYCKLCKRIIPSTGNKDRLCAVCYNKNYKNKSILNSNYVTIPASEYYQLCKNMYYKINKLKKSKTELFPPCRCTDCRCERCFGDEFCLQSSNLDTSVPGKKGEMMTPSSHQFKIKRLLRKFKQNQPFKLASPTISSSSISNISLNHSKTRLPKVNPPTPDYLNELLHLITSAGLAAPYYSIDVEETSNNDSGTNKTETRQITLSRNPLNNSPHTQYHDSFQYKLSYHSISANCSSESIPPQNTDTNTATAYNTQNTEHQNNRRQPGENYDSKNVTKSTLEVCLKDVMKLNLSQEVKLDDFTVIYKPDDVNKNNDKINFIKVKPTQKSFKHSRKPILKSTDINKNLQKQNTKWDNSSYKCNTVKPYYCATANNKGYLASSKNVRNTDSTELIRMRQTKKCYRNRSSQCVTFMEPTKNQMLQEPIQKHRKNYRSSTNIYKIENRQYDTTNEDVDYTNRDDDYKRIQRTLKEAHDYSIKLMRILEKYEKANKEFESISEKLKHHQEPEIRRKLMEKKRLDTKYVKDLRVYKSEDRALKLSATNYKHNDNALANIDTHKNNLKRILDLNYCVLDSTVDNSYELAHHASNDFCSIEHSELVPATEKSKETKLTIKEEKKKNEGIYKKSNKKRGKRGLTESKQIGYKRGWHTLKKLSSEYLIETATSLLDDESIDHDRSVEHALDQSMDDQLKTICMAPDHTAEYFPEISAETSFNEHSYKLKHEINTSYTVITKNDVSVAELEKDATQDDHLIPQRDWQLDPCLHNNKAQRTEDENSYRLKLKESLSIKPLVNNQGVSVNVFETDTRKLQSIPPQMDVEEHSCVHGDESLSTDDENPYRLQLKDKLSSDHINNEGESESFEERNEKVQFKKCPFESCDCGNKALPTTEFWIQTLMSMGLPKPILDKMYEYTEKSSELHKGCIIWRDQYKVRCVATRRESDHSVVLHWHPPTDLTRVDGYQILIDGCPTQNVVSAHKDSALITSLPHAEQLLLTVRTLLRDTEQYPSVTVVYRP